VILAGSTYQLSPNAVKGFIERSEGKDMVPGRPLVLLESKIVSK